jgi:hypothetical protein
VKVSFLEGVGSRGRDGKDQVDLVSFWVGVGDDYDCEGGGCGGWGGDYRHVGSAAGAAREGHAGNKDDEDSFHGFGRFYG